MKRISCLLLFFFLLSQVAVADVESEAEEKLKTSVDKVFTVLSDKELTMDQKKIKVVEITNSVFGYPLMAKLSLGKKHWSQFNSKQRSEFTSLFTELFQDFYIDKLDLFSDERLFFSLLLLQMKRKCRYQQFCYPRERIFNAIQDGQNQKVGGGYTILKLKVLA